MPASSIPSAHRALVICNSPRSCGLSMAVVRRQGSAACALIVYSRAHTRMHAQLLANDVLQATQMFNTWPSQARPKIRSSLRANDNDREVCASAHMYHTVPYSGTFGASAPMTITERCLIACSSLL
jgi:hypothetical protein